MVDAGDARANREEGAVGEAQQAGAERLIAHDERRQMPGVRVFPIDGDEQPLGDLRRRGEPLDGHQLAVEAFLRG